ncbi:DUF6760 family protein [Leptothoe spongobia]|uniref:DUF6760 family protein n=1 Tax=Leptothoe spongobia TaxID=2651728 RepID=UPI003899215E
MRSQLPSRANPGGGVICYPLDQLHEEVAYIALNFHWSLETILQLSHCDRRRWVTEIQKAKDSE